MSDKIKSFLEQHDVEAVFDRKRASVLDRKKGSLQHSEEFQDFLEHYGVLGMRWGRRKSRDGTYKPTKQVLAEEKRSARKKRKDKRKADRSVNRSPNRSKTLSDDELRSAINRLQLEKSFSALTAKPAQPTPVRDFLARTGTQVAANVVTQVGTAYLTRALKININKSIKPEYRVDIGKLIKD